MANNVIPDEILESVVCSSCSKYLSVKPIKIYPNRQIKCGRCVEEGDNGVESLYGLFAEEILFPCVNRYEDCRQLLKYSEVYNHEMECCSGSYPCVICNDFMGSAYELFKHFEHNHESSVIYSGEFPINMKVESMERYYLHRKRSVLLLVSVKCDKICEELFVNMTFIGSVQKNVYLKYQFVFYNLNHEIKYTTTIQNCSPFGEDAYFTKIKFSDLCKEEKVFICQIKINASQCKGLIDVSKQSQIKLKNEQQSKKLTKHRLPSRSLDKSLVHPVTEVPKLNPLIGSHFMHKLEFNNEIQFYDILESQVRPSFKRKLRLDEKIRDSLPVTIDNKFLVSNDQTSIIFITDNMKIEFEMICFGCKRNLPICSYQISPAGTYQQAYSFNSDNAYNQLSYKVSKFVYGCICPNNTVCEDCFDNWNFKKCKNNHDYTIKIEESTILAMLHYYSWNNKDIFKYSDLAANLHNFLNEKLLEVKKYCYCSGGYVKESVRYEDFIEGILKLKLSLLQIGLLGYHMLYCNYRRVSYREKLHWLMPFVTNSIQLSQLGDKSFIVVVDTLIVVETFKNDVSTTFKVHFLNKDQNENKSIASIIKFVSSRVNRFTRSSYVIFKGDFLLLNTDVNANVLISFRII